MQNTVTFNGQHYEFKCSYNYVSICTTVHTLNAVFCVGLEVAGKETEGHTFFILRGRHDTWYVFIFRTF